MKRKAIVIPLILACAAFAAWLLLRFPPPPPPILLHPSVRQFAQAQQRFEVLGSDTTTPGTQLGAQQKPRTLRLSEQDLNTYLAGSKSVQKVLKSRGVQAVQIVLTEPAGLTIHAAVRLGRQPQNVQIEGTLAPDPQTGLRFTASRAQVGRFPLPAVIVTRQAEVLAQRLILQMHRRLPLTIQSVQVQKKDLVLVGIPVLARAAASSR